MMSTISGAIATVLAESVMERAEFLQIPSASVMSCRRCQSFDGA